MHCFIYFADNDLHKNPDKEAYDPLPKVSYVIDEVVKGINRAWQVVKLMAIDESMIKYMDQTVPHIHHMSTKPIKYGINVYVLCCAVSSIMLACQMYCRKHKVEPKTTKTIKICELLFSDIGLLTTRGCSFIQTTIIPL